MTRTCVYLLVWRGKMTKISVPLRISVAILLNCISSFMLVLHTHTLAASTCLFQCLLQNRPSAAFRRRRRRLRCGLFCFNYACVLYCRKEFVDCQWKHNL